MNRVTTVYVLGFLLLILLLSAAVIRVFNSSEQKNTMQAPPVIQGMIMPMAKNIGEFELQQSNNQVFNHDSLKGTWSLLFIGYTQCPDVCPMALTSLKQTISIMAKKGMALPQVVFVSIDPDRDNTQSLNDYLNYFNKDFIGVTGDEEDLDEFIKQLALYYRKVPGTSGDVNNDDYLMEHSASLLLVNPQGKPQAVLKAPHIPKILIESIDLSRKYYRANIE